MIGTARLWPWCFRSPPYPSRLMQWAPTPWTRPPYRRILERSRSGMCEDQPAVPSTIIEEAVPSLDSTGVPNLDLILGGGLIRGTLTIVVGPPGSGKTTLAMQIAFAAARAGRKVL